MIENGGWLFYLIGSYEILPGCSWLTSPSLPKLGTLCHCFKISQEWLPQMFRNQQHFMCAQDGDYYCSEEVGGELKDGIWTYFTWYMDVSQNGGTPKWMVWKILLKWMIWGYPYFRKPPYTVLSATQKQTINLGMDSYHAVIVILGMVYNWVYHVEPIAMHQQQERKQR